jgi:hypothetical protein
MPEGGMKQGKVRFAGMILLVLAAGMACQLTSPRPASWSGTPTAEARNTQIALTQAAGSEADYLITATDPPILPEIQPTPTPTATATPPEEIADGPWLVYPAPGGSGYHAYDIQAETIVEISLPAPIIPGDLIHGRSPDGRTLIVRAGSEQNTDEFALYQIDLPSFMVSKITPLLSISLQRKIVDQEGTSPLDALSAVTRADGLAWSPDGRFLAFSAALHNETSDLYVLDTLNERVDRLNGLFTQNASPMWSPNSNWLVSQELENNQLGDGWRAHLVSGLRVPTFDDQNTIYMPRPGSLEEVFVGWLNVHTFISYSLTASGPSRLRQVNVDTRDESLIFESSFQQLAIDPASGVMALILSNEDAVPLGGSGGVYRLPPESTLPQLQQAGDWDQVSWDPGGKFVAGGSQGLTMFTPQGEGMRLPSVQRASLSPSQNWLIAWGTAGASLFQSASNHPLQTLLEGRVEALVWQPDSHAFFILSEGTLYRFEFPGLKPNEIADGFTGDQALEFIWVE